MSTTATPPAIAEDPALADLVAQVRAAQADRQPLQICGGGSKAFYGETPRPDLRPLDVRGLRGISRHEPTELVVTVRAGTSLAELEATLAAHGQWLPFEPPHYGVDPRQGTVGGMVAAGLAGPARATAGGVRDYVLGASVLNGRGQLLSFGGQVMKNVAGYDIARLLPGSLGVLGVICEVSLKVLPMPPASCTLRFELDELASLKRLQRWGTQPLPVSASAWWNGMLVVRLAGAVAAVEAARAQFGGEEVDAPLARDFWQGLRDQRDEFFINAQQAIAVGATLWRLSVPQSAPAAELPGEHLIEWGGAQRWCVTTAPATKVREIAQRLRGHATAFRGQREPGVFAPLPGPQAEIQRRLKAEFDPDGLFNPGRLYPDL
ncbi:glycolate oxidase subunit GlcE [Ideonella sp. BYS139W]|uniref:Glycolate oxidase subunit GlcE n=1 Tax=Pseudaquabacterium rugosum TaxID=2984194 RepID=A0ABU9B923_9BURK